MGKRKSEPEEMTQSAEVTSGPDTSWKSLYKAGGISFLLAGVLFFTGVLAFILGPNTFGASGEEALKVGAANRSLYILGSVIFCLSTIFLVPGILALYVAVKHLDKSYALLGAGIILFSLTSLVLSNSAGAILALSESTQLPRLVRNVQFSQPRRRPSAPKVMRSPPVLSWAV